MWSILFLTLPTQPTAVRLRIWRALKSLGSPLLRDGVYLLPLEHQDKFRPLVNEVHTHGGSAQVMHLSPTDDTQRNELLALFDRKDAYQQWHTTLNDWLRTMTVQSEAEARRRLRSVEQALRDIRAIDYCPGEAGEHANAALVHARAAFDARFFPGEPHGQQDQNIARLNPTQFQNRCWATRERPWADRLASAWLIRRFIDPQAQFTWLKEVTQVPTEALGFDFDGARFTHVGERVTFEVLLIGFGLDHNPQLSRIGRTIRYLDVGGMPVAEASGLEAVLAGLRVLHLQDDALLDAACAVFDALLAHTTEPKQPS